MRRNSVLDGLKVQFDDIQDEISEMVDCRSEMTEGKFLGVNETKSCHPRIVDARWWKS